MRWRMGPARCAAGAGARTVERGARPRKVESGEATCATSSSFKFSISFGCIFAHVHTWLETSLTICDARGGPRTGSVRRHRSGKDYPCERRLGLGSGAWRHICV